MACCFSLAFILCQGHNCYVHVTLSMQGMKKISAEEKIVRIASALNAHLQTKSLRGLGKGLLCTFKASGTDKTDQNFHFQGQKNKSYFILISCIWVPSGNWLKSR